MAATVSPRTPAKDALKRKDKVVAAVSMPGVPEGTAGRVVMVAGFEWIRYWVRFENGVVRGSIDRRKLARPDEYQELLERRARGDDAQAEGQTIDGGSQGAPTADGAAGGGDGYVHNGVLVPQLLLDRSKKARERLGA